MNENLQETRQIVVVDGEKTSRERIEQSLIERPVACRGVGSAREALEELEREPPDLVILDLYLPDLSGLGLCRLIRENPALDRIPVIVVTAQASEIDRILAFEAGADDFLPKPFYPPELSARVAAVLRGFRGSASAERSPSTLVRVDAETGRAEARGERLDLTPTEFEILSALLSEAGRVVRRRDLIQRLWGTDAPQSDRAIDAHVKSIRRKLGSLRDCVETVRGVGYRYFEEA